MRAVNEFNLSFTGSGSEADNEMGIWDGNQLVLTVCYILRPLATLTTMNMRSVLWHFLFSMPGQEYSWLGNIKVL